MKLTKKIISILMLMAMLLTSISVCFVSNAAQNAWTAAWGSPPVKAGINLGQKNAVEKGGVQLRDVIPARSTIRTVITTTLGGSKIRLKFTNQYGANPLTINEATIAKCGDNVKSVKTSTLKQITFNGGEKSVTIAAGSEVLSDEISFSCSNLDKLSVSMYFASTTRLDTQGMFGGETYLCSLEGNKTHQEKMPNASVALDFKAKTITYHTIPFLSRLDVYSPGSYCFVIFGDSTVTNDSYLKLEEKLIKNNITNVGVIMSGIIGNRVLYDGAGIIGSIYGDAAISRFSRDCLSMPGCKYALVKLGLNDIIHPNSKSMKGKAPSATVGQIENGYVELARQARGSGIALTLCNRPPFKGYERNFLGDSDFVWSESMHKTILSINDWIGRSATRNGYTYSMNIDKMVDKTDSTRIYPHLTTDGAHLSQNGQIAFVDLIPEHSYGVHRSLTPLQTLRKVDPYVVPVTTTAAATKKPSNNTPTEKKTEAPTRANITPATTSPVQIAVPSSSPQTTEKATQIVVNNATPQTKTPAQNGGGDNINVVVDDKNESVQTSSVDKKPIILLSVAAVIAIAVIVTCIVLLSRTGASLTAFNRGTDSTKFKKKRNRNIGV